MEEVGESQLQAEIMEGKGNKGGDTILLRSNHHMLMKNQDHETEGKAPCPLPYTLPPSLTFFDCLFFLLVMVAFQECMQAALCQLTPFPLSPVPAEVLP